MNVNIFKTLEYQIVHLKLGQSAQQLIRELLTDLIRLLYIIILILTRTFSEASSYLIKNA